MQPILTWNDRYATGIREIDRDHKLLFEMVANLQQAPEAETRDNLLSAIEVLREYTVHHFRREERLMELFDYPGLIAHRREHRELEAQVQDYAQAFFDTESRADYSGFCMFLHHWLVDHIIDRDLQYRSHISDLDRANAALEQLQLVEPVLGRGGAVT